MYNFDNSEIKIVLEKISEGDYEETKRYCCKYIEEHDDVAYMCKYIINLLNRDSIKMEKLMKNFSSYDVCSIASEFVRLLEALDDRKDEFYFSALKDASYFISSIAKKYYYYPEEFEKNKDFSLYESIYDNGIILRGLALNLAGHFYKNNDYKNELKMLGIRVFVTDVVMNGLTHFTVPSTADYADCLDRLKRRKQAYIIYEDLYNEFGWIVDKYVSNDEELEISVEDMYVIKALNIALKGMYDILPDEKSKLTFNKIKEMLNKSYIFT